jgi:hypothetical protein
MNANGDLTYSLDSPGNLRAVNVEYWLERAAWLIGALFDHNPRATYERCTMESIIRTLVVYLFLLLVFRLASKWTLSHAC